MSASTERVIRVLTPCLQHCGSYALDSNETPRERNTDLRDVDPEVVPGSSPELSAAGGFRTLNRFLHRRGPTAFARLPCDRVRVVPR